MQLIKLENEGDAAAQMNFSNVGSKRTLPILE